MAIGPDTPVTLSLKTVVGLVAIAVSAFWALSTWTSSGLREDVTAIRATLERLDGSDKANALSIGEARQAFIKQVGDTQKEFTSNVGDLKLTLANFGAKVDALSGRMDKMNQSIDGLSGQLSKVQGELSYRPVASIDPKALQAAIEKSGAKVIFLPVPTAPSEPH